MTIFAPTQRRQRYPLDREAYTDAKTTFVAHILRQAGFKERVAR
ncbi:MAG: hypothetical protein ACK5O7_01055 [Holosporales bacterium]